MVALPVVTAAVEADTGAVKLVEGEVVLVVVVSVIEVVLL